MPNNISTESYNSVLKTLASTPHSWPNNLKLTFIPKRKRQGRFLTIPSDVETIAKTILPKIPHPNTETYNSYIQCLRTSPQNCQQVLDQMKQTNVPPDIHTFNLLLQHTHDRDLVQDYLTMISQNGIHPNQETFMIILQGLRGDDFNFDLAKEYVTIMTEQYNLPLNIDVCNAALSHCHHVDLLQTEKRFLIMDDDTVMETRHDAAQKQEQWLHEMKNTFQVSPNITTYESIIQTWTRTRTLSGLLKAEEYAVELVSPLSSASRHTDLVRPRRDTFRPILMAWAASALPEGVTRVSDWIDTLEELEQPWRNDDDGTLTPDAQMMSCGVMAWWHCSQGEDENNGERLAECAIKCTEWMERTLACSLKSECDSSSPDPCYGSIFYKVMEAWGRILSSCNPTDTGITVVSAIATMTDKLDHVSVKESMINGESPIQDIFTLTLSNLLNYTNNMGRNGFERYFPLVDVMLDKCYLLWRLQQQRMRETIKNDHNTSNKDTTTGTRDEKEKPTTYLTPPLQDFYLKILQGCKDHLSSHDHRKGDVIRTVIRIMEQTNSQQHYRRNVDTTTASSKQQPYDYTNIYLELIDTIVVTIPTPKQPSSGEESTNKYYRDKLLRRIAEGARRLSNFKHQSQHGYNLDYTKIMEKLKVNGVSSSISTDASQSQVTSRLVKTKKYGGGITAGGRGKKRFVGERNKKGHAAGSGSNRRKALTTV